MIAIFCVDTENGMMFNNRRQSQDREVRKNISEIIKDQKLWMNEYSFGQFKEDNMQIIVDENLANKAASGEYCFFEDMIPEENCLERIILYRWDKKYPSEMTFSINLSGWRLTSTLELEGYSHKLITREVYDKNVE